MHICFIFIFYFLLEIALQGRAVNSLLLDSSVFIKSIIEDEPDSASAESAHFMVVQKRISASKKQLFRGSFSLLTAFFRILFQLFCGWRKKKSNLAAEFKVRYE